MKYAHLSKEFAKEKIQITNGQTLDQNKKAISKENASSPSEHCHKTAPLS
jgi:hypothetical protein